MRLFLITLAALCLSGCYEPGLTKQQVDEQIKACKDNGAISTRYWVGGFSNEVKRIECIFPLGDTDKTYTRPATEFLK